MRSPSLQAAPLPSEEAPAVAAAEAGCPDAAQIDLPGLEKAGEDPGTATPAADAAPAVAAAEAGCPDAAQTDLSDLEKAGEDPGAALPLSQIQGRCAAGAEETSPADAADASPSQAVLTQPATCAADTTGPAGGAAAPAAFRAPQIQPAGWPGAVNAAAVKPARKKRLYLLCGAALFALLAAAVVLIAVHNARQIRYNEGVTLLENGAYAEALETFTALGAFEDAADMAAYARKAIAYEQAKELYAAGNYAAAATLFISAGDYRDASALAAECRQRSDYAAAKELMEKGKYAQAKDLLAPLAAALFPDRDVLLEECTCMPDYLEAEAQLEAGHNYSAYQLFTGLGDFRDAASRAEGCLVSAPATGETYRNSSYSAYDCALTIKPPTDDGSRTYVKIYDAGGTLISCVFIDAGRSATVLLPAGDFVLKSAYGYGPWFGETDMFGDDGTYQVLKSGETSEVFSLEGNFSYVLTLRTSGSGGDAVSTEDENREDF